MTEKRPAGVGLGKETKNDVVMPPAGEGERASPMGWLRRKLRPGETVTRAGEAEGEPLPPIGDDTSAQNRRRL